MLRISVIDLGPQSSAIKSKACLSILWDNLTATGMSSIWVLIILQECCMANLSAGFVGLNQLLDVKGMLFVHVGKIMLKQDSSKSMRATDCYLICIRCGCG